MAAAPKDPSDAAPADHPAVKNYIETAGISYGALALETMDVFLPPNPGHLTGAVILIHGGAWFSGDKSTFEPTSTYKSFQKNFAAAFANHGIAVFDIDFALLDASHNWSDIYSSVEAAVAYIKAHAAEFNVDPNAIGAIGGSSGAQIASMLGVSGQVAFVGDNSGPVDLTTSKLIRPIHEMLGTSPDAIRGASPIYNIGAGTAPFFITQGLSDLVETTADARAFYNALLSNGVSATMVTYAGGHMFKDATLATCWSVLDKEITWVQHQIAADMAAPPALVGHMAAMGGRGGDGFGALYPTAPPAALAIAAPRAGLPA